METILKLKRKIQNGENIAENYELLIKAVTKKRDELVSIESKIVKKGWGKEIWFVNNDEYCGKILCFDKGKKFSKVNLLD